jgi:hypothetical protein
MMNHRLAILSSEERRLDMLTRELIARSRVLPP